MTSGPPWSGIPAPVLAVADGCAVQPVWINELGGFVIGAGGQRRFVKWAPAGSGLELAAEAARLRWAARFTPVPSLLGQGADGTGSWIITNALPGQTAISDRWTAEPKTAVTAIGQGLRALHDALPTRGCPFSASASQRLADARDRAGQGLINPGRWHPEHQHLSVPQRWPCSPAYGDETLVVWIHAGNGPHKKIDLRAIACFDQALEDVGLTAAGPLRQVLHDYFAWATTTTMSRYHESADDVPEGLSIPRWSWDGLQR